MCPLICCCRADEVTPAWHPRSRCRTEASSASGAHLCRESESDSSPAAVEPQEPRHQHPESMFYVVVLIVFLFVCRKVFWKRKKFPLFIFPLFFFEKQSHDSIIPLIFIFKKMYLFWVARGKYLSGGRLIKNPHTFLKNGAWLLYNV